MEAIVLERIKQLPPDLHDEVIDFIDFRIWPVFNIADSAITVGAIIIAFKCFRLSAK